MKLEEVRKTSKTIYDGNIIKLEVDTAILPDETEAIREVVRHPGGVGVVAVDEDNSVYLVRQFRYPYSKVTLEIPAGKLDAGEEPETAGRRELLEETGFTANYVEKLGSFYASPGFCDETYHVYLATGLTKGKAQPDEDEFVECARYPLCELLTMIDKGEIKDAKTVIGILMAKEKLQK